MATDPLHWARVGAQVAESDWLLGRDRFLSHAMLRLLKQKRANRTKAGRRTLRLLACAACRWPAFWTRLSPAQREVIDKAEAWAEGGRAPAYVERAAGVRLSHFQQYAVLTIFAAIDDNVFRAAVNACKNILNACGRDETAGGPMNKQIWEEIEVYYCSLIRHLFGNPFRPYPAPPAWPSTVVQLTESFCDGQDCGFALHDALLEAGHAELAEHIRQETWHPKGCWVLDTLLGKH